ncbi:MAG TPA: response regulator [Verrucomicrobiae bacterium]|nr:response regulator [Verrucomicrobiae bacterium]
MAGIDRFEQGAEYEDYWALPSQRVLLVDDDRGVVDAQAVLLETLGQDVRCASDGATALKIAVEFRPQVVLLDLDMPGMSGLEVARRLRILHPTRNARLVAQTGLSRLAPPALRAPAAFDGWICKPASLATLIAELRATAMTRVPAYARPVAAIPVRPR